MDFQQRRRMGVLGSVVLHAVILLVGGITLANKAEFGIKAGETSTEVNLVAAAPEPQVPQPPAPVLPPPAPLPAALKPDDVVEPTLTKLMPVPVPAAIPKPDTGHDTVTMRASQGAKVAASPDYLRNPAPVYPESEQLARHQGVIHLLVDVSERGEPMNITVQQSSGYRRLDDAAVRAVRDWKFKPATVGGIPIASQAEVPIRFEMR